LDKTIALTLTTNFLSFSKRLNLSTKGGDFEVGKTGAIGGGLSIIAAF